MNIKTVTVLGANGTMGRNIAAVFALYGAEKVYMVSRSMEKSETAKPLAVAGVKDDSVADKLIPADYSMLEECIGNADLIFESVAENYEAKDAILAQMLPYLKPTTLIGTGSSGLSINKLAEMLPEELRKNYYGMHFFNPPYSLTLFEVIASKYSDEAVTKDLAEYFEKTMRRTVVNVADEAAFLGNRVGFQFINEAMQYAETYKEEGGIDYIDAIMGKFTGRGLAPIATADFVALDVSKAIVDNVYENTSDYARETFVLPEYAMKLIAEGKLGRKVKQGLYKAVKNEDGSRTMFVYDIVTGEYRESKKYTFEFATKMTELLKDEKYTEAMDVLKADQSKEGKICLSFLLKHIVYAVSTGNLVSDGAESSDKAMASGYGWAPPVSIIDLMGGVDEFAKLCKENLDASLLEAADFDAMLKTIPASSTYDYKKFFRIKK